MRELTSAALIERLIAAIGRAARHQTNVYFTGGVTAVLHAWRDTTVDVDLKLVPDSDEILRAIPALKEELHINVELAAPDQFIPELPGWQERSVFIRTEGRASFFHYDLYSQALSKIERGHARDLADVERMLADALVVRSKLWDLYERIEPELYRYPAIDPASFRRAVRAVTNG